MSVNGGVPRLHPGQALSLMGSPLLRSLGPLFWRPGQAFSSVTAVAASLGLPERNATEFRTQPRGLLCPSYCDSC